jgi:hypothetical protein
MTPARSSVPPSSRLPWRDQPSVNSEDNQTSVMPSVTPAFHQYDSTNLPYAQHQSHASHTANTPYGQHHPTSISALIMPSPFSGLLAHRSVAPNTHRTDVYYPGVSTHQLHAQEIQTGPGGFFSNALMNTQASDTTHAPVDPNSTQMAAAHPYHGTNEQAVPASYASSTTFHDASLGRYDDSRAASDERTTLPQYNHSFDGAGYLQSSNDSFGSNINGSDQHFISTRASSEGLMVYAHGAMMSNSTGQSVRASSEESMAPAYGAIMSNTVTGQNLRASSEESIAQAYGAMMPNSVNGHLQTMSFDQSRHLYPSVQATAMSNAVNNFNMDASSAHMFSGLAHHHRYSHDDASHGHQSNESNQIGYSTGESDLCSR